MLTPGGYRRRFARTLACAVCGKPFHAVRLDAHTCSPKCRKTLSRYMRGELHLWPAQEMHLVRHFGKDHPASKKPPRP